MKTSKQIITSLQNQSNFSKLSNWRCIDKIISIFTPPMQKMIKFAYIKKDVIYFVLSHPAGKQEFNYAIKNIQPILKIHKPKECQNIEIKQLKAFVSNNITLSKTISACNSKVTYKERANGNFTINIKDDKLKKLIQNIQEIIKKNATND